MDQKWCFKAFCCGVMAMVATISECLANDNIKEFPYFQTSLAPICCSEIAFDGVTIPVERLLLTTEPFTTIDTSIAKKVVENRHPDSTFLGNKIGADNSKLAQPFTVVKTPFSENRIGVVLYKTLVKSDSIGIHQVRLGTEFLNDKRLVLDPLLKKMTLSQSLSEPIGDPK